MGTKYLPFEVGQVVESRCFLFGFRGAWFQCKIKDIGWRMGSLSYELEYVDFPDEKVEWTKPFQKPPAGLGIPSTGSKGELMIRPQFPDEYCKKKLCNVSTNSQPEATVAVNDKWNVGDLVDWWKDNCYWCGRIIAILGHKEVKIELLPPPFGEGLTYEASCKDLRPSMNWSPKSGWTASTIEVSGFAECAQFPRHENEGQKWSGEEYGIQAADKKFQNSSASDSSVKRKDGSARTLKRMHADLASKKKNRNTLSRSRARDLLTEIRGTTPAADGSEDDWSLEKIVSEIPINSMHNDSVEAAIVDLEELMSRIKWIKSIVDFGMPLPNPSGSSSSSSWKFLEHRPSPAPE